MLLPLLPAFVLTVVLGERLLRFQVYEDSDETLPLIPRLLEGGTALPTLISRVSPH